MRHLPNVMGSLVVASVSKLAKPETEHAQSLVLLCFFFLSLQPMQAAELIDSEFRPDMSNRQKNKAKRMAKLVAKQRSRDLDPNEKR